MIARFWRLVRAPSAELARIGGETPTARALLLHVAAPLALIAAFAPALGQLIFGARALGIVYRPDILPTLGGALVAAGLIVLALYLIALAIDRVAPLLQGRADATRALQTSVYAASPALIATGALIVPALWPLTLVGLASLVVLHRALPILMGAPPNRATAFAVVVVVVALILVLLLAALSACVAGFV